MEMTPDITAGLGCVPARSASPESIQAEAREQVALAYLLYAAQTQCASAIRSLIASHPYTDYLNKALQWTLREREVAVEAFHRENPVASKLVQRTIACADAMDQALNELTCYAADIGAAELVNLVQDISARMEVSDLNPYLDLPYWEDVLDDARELWDAYEDRLRMVGCDFDPDDAEERSYRLRLREWETEQGVDQ